MNSTPNPQVLRLEQLELRIVPSTLNIIAGDTATTLIQAGDTGEDALGNVILDVSKGAVLAFVTDDGDGVYESGELTGLALADGTRVGVLDDVNGDVATNLDADGTLSDGTVADDGKALLARSIAELDISGTVQLIVAGNDISNVQVEDAAGIATGTEAGGQTLDFGNGNFTLL